MEIVGYTDRWSARAGGHITLMVSSRAARFTADVVRLIHGDDNPAGPGFKSEAVAWEGAGEYEGRLQPLRPGSFLVAAGVAQQSPPPQLTMAAWFRTALPALGRPQTIVAWRGPDDDGGDGPGAGWSLGLDPAGYAELCISDGVVVHRTAVREQVPASRWWFVAARYDAVERVARVTLRSHTGFPIRPAGRAERHGAEAERVPLVPTFGAPVTVAARADHVDGAPPGARDHFNGKIEAPRVFGRWLDDHELETVAESGSVQGVLAGWDFVPPHYAMSLADVSGNGHTAELLQMPTRAVTGHLWDGRAEDPEAAPEQYAAVHFHDDDLEDAGWAPSFSVTVAPQWRSGVYAVRLATDGAEDFVPFFVRPAAPKSSLLFLAPTFSYLAYGDIEVVARLPEQVGVPVDLQPQDRFVIANRLRSLYDTHPDGSGVCHASRLRPLVNIRPKVKMQFLQNFQGSPHLLNADLHLIDWMETKGYAYDVATDDDLHDEGVDLLAPYRVVVTGTHPEYWSQQMLDGLSGYLAGGGQVMYMGANGLYCVTSRHPQRPHVIEIRRSNGTRTWETAPGEHRHSTTGEPGGIWRLRGRPPQVLVGTGFTAQGFDCASPYRRQPDSFDARAAFIFDGIGDDEVIGDFPSLALERGAAGYELDRVDLALGSPPTTLRLASSFGHSSSYLLVSDDVPLSRLDLTADTNPLVRADMAYVEHPDGGRVFSTGSITWCACLSYDNYDNNVSRITQNVLEEFLRRESVGT